MATGKQGPKVRRTYVLEPELSDDGRIVRQRALTEEIVLDLLGAIWSVGGAIRIVADRVLMGELPGEEGSDPEPVGETVGVVIEYHANTPLNRESVTQYLMSKIDGESEPVTPPPVKPGAVDEALEALGVKEDGDDDEAAESAAEGE